MSPAETSDAERLSVKAEAFMTRPLSPLARAMGFILLAGLSCGGVASFFIKVGPQADATLARVLAQMFLRR